MNTNQTFIELSNILKAELADRKGRNPTYSLRAFARDLALSPGFLSRLMNGKKGISFTRAQTLMIKLRIDDPSKTDRLLRLAALSSVRDAKSREFLVSSLEKTEAPAQ